jgi:glucose/arabinose dehydrogenase
MSGLTAFINKFIFLLLIFSATGFGNCGSSGGGSNGPNTASGGDTSPDVRIEMLASGFVSPVHVTQAGDASNRLFVVEQGGVIKIIKGSSILTEPFLDITGRVRSGGERGLLSAAFPADFVNKRYFYVYYTGKPDGATVVARYQVDSANPDLALPASEEILLTVNQPFSNHNGGQIAFGPDNFLYIGLGDGGSGGDPQGNGQRTDTLLGKLLRIDVESGAKPYDIPAGNPFVGMPGFRPEIWALGLRNPWRFSFDRKNGDLYIADVGQNKWEEINYQSHAGAGGENYGWNIMEGAHCYNAAICDQSKLILPVIEYDHSKGCSVTGGFVYRGDKFIELQGMYFYGDYCEGTIWGLRLVNGEWQNNLLIDTDLNISSFGDNEAGDLFVVDLSGSLYEIRAASF